MHRCSSDENTWEPHKNVKDCDAFHEYVEEYDVEEIVDSRLNCDGVTREYHVKWAGCAPQRHTSQRPP